MGMSFDPSAYATPPSAAEILELAVRVANGLDQPARHAAEPAVARGTIAEAGEAHAYWKELARFAIDLEYRAHMVGVVDAASDDRAQVRDLMLAQAARDRLHARAVRSVMRAIREFWSGTPGWPEEDS